MKKMMKNLNPGMKMMMHRQVDPNAPSITNPIQLLHSFNPLSETSLVDQAMTKYKIQSGGPTSLLALSANPAFSLIVTTLIYAPGKKAAMECSDIVPAQPDGTPAQKRKYTKIFQTKFNDGYRMAGFILTGIGPVTGEVNIIVTHQPCKRRIVFADEFINIDTSSTLPLDQSSDSQASQPGDGEIQSATIKTTNDNELVYCVVGVGGNFTQFYPPTNFFAIQDISTNIDRFDATLKTFYKLTSAQGQYKFTANMAGTNFTWGTEIYSLNAGTLVKA